MQPNMEKFHSLPNIRRSSDTSEEKPLRSLSLSQLENFPEFSDFHAKPSPFSLRWIHGFNPKAGVINLNNKGSTIVFYAACNCGILFNWTTHEMKILQGHRHMLACIAADSNGKWLVTADSGSENILTIWDSVDCFPYKTLFSPHRDLKLAKVAMSGDAKFLITLAYRASAEIFWWIWSFGLDEPHATLEVPIPQDGVIDMSFNPHNYFEFLLMTKKDIWLGRSKKIFVFERGEWRETENYELKIKTVEKKVGSDTGNLSCFTFVEGTSQVLAATNRGSILIYGYTVQYQAQVDSSNYENLKFIKVLKIQKNKINVIQNIDGVIVVGNNLGEIHFYDEQLKLLYWVHGFQVDSIRGISFNVSPRSYKIFDPKCNMQCLCWEKVETETDPDTGLIKQKLIKKNIPSDSTVGNKPFIVRDFIVCSNNMGVYFVDFVTEKLELIMDFKISTALALSVHPEKPLVSIGYSDGRVELLNFIKHKLFKRLDLRDRHKVVIPPKEDSIKCDYETTVPDLSVTCLKYSPSGLHLSCGLNSGQLFFLDPITLDILTEVPLKDTGYSITEITFSCDSLTMAFADSGKTVCVYKYDCEKLMWYFVGKHRAHYKDITAVFFTPVQNDSGDYKLFSIGMDRIMVEYDVGASADEYLVISSLDRIDQTAVPLACILWPTPNEDLDPELYRHNMPLILTANDEFKYKILNYKTAMTLSTILGPRYESPVLKMILTKKTTAESEYLLFATKNIIGLQKMPLDGNPWKHAGLLGHPIKILQICFRENSGTLFTIGAKDACMCQWSANYSAVDKTTSSGGADLDPYYCLLEDGRPGWLFREIRDLFYYIQILCQGTFTPAKRQVKDFIPIDSLPDMMRALGYFPSEYEVEDLLVEAKYKVNRRCASTEVDFDEFVKLYLNHRPAFGDSLAKIKNAFRNFATLDRNEYSISREDFVDMLGSYGERFPADLTWYLLSILCGHTFEERAVLKQGNYSFLPEDRKDLLGIDKNFTRPSCKMSPTNNISTITLDELVSGILGIRDMDALYEMQSALGSTASRISFATSFE